MSPGAFFNFKFPTIVWRTVEAAVSLWTAWNSLSPALPAFGGDSLIELLSAAVVFWRFRFTLNEARAPEKRAELAQKLAGVADVHFETDLRIGRERNSGSKEHT
jgi:hypothetical protein